MAFGSKLATVNLVPESPPAHPQVTHFPGLFADRADALLAGLLNELELRPDELVIRGTPIKTKRLHDFRADPGMTYHYSGGHHADRPWTPILAQLKGEVERATGARFNACLCNYYQDGSVGMGWHADKEMELGCQPTIASLSFGAQRLFRFRRRTPWRETGRYEKWNYPLCHGDALLMQGDTQRFFEHELAPSTKIRDPRLNLTFRLVLGTRPTGAGSIHDF